MSMTEKRYRCRECGHEVRIKTNHFVDCYPVCQGKCRQILNPHTAREKVLPKQTAHECLETERPKDWRYWVEKPTGEVPVWAVAEFLGLTEQQVIEGSPHGARYVGGTSVNLIWREDALALEKEHGVPA